MGKKKIWGKQKKTKRLLKRKNMGKRKKRKTLLPAKGGPPHALSEPAAASGGQPAANPACGTKLSEISVDFGIWAKKKY